MNSNQLFVFTFAILSAFASAAAKDISPADMENDAEKIYNKIADGLNVGAIVIGVFLAVVGYRHRRVSFATMGFVAAGGLTFLAVDTYVDPTSSAHAWAPVTGLLVAGIAGGLVCALLMNVGVFAAGASLGVVLAMVLQTALLHRVQTNPENLLMYITMAVLGLLFGFLAIKMRRSILIVATAYVGTFLATYGVGHFAGSLPSPFDLASAIDSTAKAGASAVPTTWWIYLGCIVVIGTACVFVQHFVTGKDKKKPEAVEEYLVLESGNQFATEKQFIEAGPHKAIHGTSLAYN